MPLIPTPPAGSAGPWVQKWLSPPRHAVYVTAAGGDHERALALYEWNAQLSSALLRDLAHLEVALRNAYDRALSARWPEPPHWTSNGAQVFAPLYRRRGRRIIDLNERLRDSLGRALTQAGGPTAPPGKIIAELMFGFWRYLSSSGHEKTLWVPCLHHAFPPGTNRRRDVDARVGRLQDLRNRVAHAEPLLRIDVMRHLRDLLALATMLDPQFGKYLAATTSVVDVVAARP